MNTKQIAVGLILLIVSLSSHGVQPLVDVKWLMDNQAQPDLVILDLQPTNYYSQYHIPGAINSSYGDWRRPNSKGVPKMLPPVADLEKMIGRLGIDESTHVILVVTGRSASEMASATRVYWTLKALGHDQVSILDGGLVAWANVKGNPLERQINRPEAKTFKAKVNSNYLVTADEILGVLGGQVAMVDSRSVAEFMGILGGGGKERAGTIPGSVNLPFDWLTENSGATFHNPENLKRIYQAAGVPLDGDQISFCHTGHRTSLAWFVSHELLGNKQARMYDGSTAEWSIDASLPIERKVELICSNCPVQ